MELTRRIDVAYLWKLLFLFKIHHFIGLNFQSRATRLYTPLCPSVGRLVGPHFTFFMFLRSLASPLLPKCSSNSITAPAHPHATEVAVYPALFLSTCGRQLRRFCFFECIGSIPLFLLVWQHKMKCSFTGLFFFFNL